MRNCIKANLKKKLNRAISELLKPTYFNGIPLGQIFNLMEEHGIVPLQEDNTKWSGFLCGASGECFFELAPADSKDENGMYKPYTNTGLRMTWYEMRSGRYEVIAYFT